MTPDKNIQKIIRLCIGGDRSAQKHFYLLLCDELMQTAFRYVQEIEHAKDVVQDTFVRIFHNLDKFDSEVASIRTWAKKICINEAIAFLRKHKKMAWTVDINEVILGFHPEQDNPDIKAEEIRQKMDRLPEEHKTILQMYYFDELSHKEIAALLNIQETSSRSRLSRAREILRINWKAALFF